MTVINYYSFTSSFQSSHYEYSSLDVRAHFILLSLQNKLPLASVILVQFQREKALINTEEL